jgi:hypothetical protein
MNEDEMCAVLVLEIVGYDSNTFKHTEVCKIIHS